MPTQARIAIVGAGPAGLMAAEVLSQYGYELHVFEQKPSAARKFLMAGKTGLNISHAEALPHFIARYDAQDWLAPWIESCDANWIREWMTGLGIQSYVGSSGRIFPVEMKAAPLLRAWLARLNAAQVKFHYRHQVTALDGQHLSYQALLTGQGQTEHFDAIVLATGAVSWPQLGSDGAWQQWLKSEQIAPFQASNAGVRCNWSSYMHPMFGQALKRVAAWVADEQKNVGDIVISQYGLESGLVYKQGRALRSQLAQSTTGKMYLSLDLCPDVEHATLLSRLQPKAKQSLANTWRKAGLDAVKIALLRELVDKALWQDPQAMAGQIKHLNIPLDGFRPIEEAISCAGGVKQQALNEALMLKSHPAVFCCGEMLDWDAPTGGYLLTACFATGRAAGQAVHTFLQQQGA